MGGEKGEKNYRRIGQVFVGELGLRRFSVNGGDGMGRREVGGQGEFVDFKQLRQGDLIAAGVWVGTRKGKYGPIFEIYDEEKEENILVPGSGQLKHKMKEYCRLGTFVEIEYDGQEKMREGTYRGANVHCFRVFVDEDYQPKTALGQAAIGKSQDANVFERGGDEDDGYEPPARIRDRDTRDDQRGSRDRRDSGMDRRDDRDSRDRVRDDRDRDRNPPSRDSRSDRDTDTRRNDRSSRESDRNPPSRDDRASRDSRRQTREEPPRRRDDLDDDDDDLGLI